MPYHVCYCIIKSFDSFESSLRRLVGELDMLPFRYV